MRAAASLRRPAIHLLFPSSQGQPAPPRLSRLLHHRFTSSAPSWSRQQTASPLIPRFSPLHVPSRSYRPGSARNRPTTKRHLYVLLVNDCGKGFDVHKLDMDDDTAGTPLRRLPETPAVRVGTGRWTKFAALGSTIVATGRHQDGVTAIYDTKTAQLATSDDLPLALYGGDGPDRVMAAGNTLYAFESYSDQRDFGCPRCEVRFRGGLHCLRADATEDDKLWKWRPLPNTPRFSWSCNSSTPELPFDAARISSYAVHPRGRTIFVSAGGYQIDVGTFTYGTASGKWKRRGNWVLPFVGRGQYDPQLDAWVGFHRLDPDYETLDDLKWETTYGHLCACRVTSASASRQPPEWKVSKETLLQEDTPDWSLLEAHLVYMADRGEYCLVEHLAVNDMTTYVLRLSMFRIKYGEDGELTTTAPRPTRSYEVPGDDHRFDAAFWL